MRQDPKNGNGSEPDIAVGGPSLYLVATPIGNLEDITLRALRVLKEVDLIACEDTRQTLKLLSHYGIKTRLVSYHEHNEMTKAAELVVDLEGGAKIALVTDAGMPGISDPGFRLIALAIRHHVPVIPIPGACAFLAALVASGLPTDSFRFSGFLPSKSGQRRKLLESVKDSPRTQVFYEAPHRLLETLADVVEVLGNDRHVVVAREVTKMHEEFLRGRAEEILKKLKARGDVKGEITLLIAKVEEGSSPVRIRRRNRRPARQADHVRRKGRRKSRAEESSQRARHWEERGVSGVAAREVTGRRSALLFPRQLLLYRLADHLPIHSHAGGGEVGHGGLHHCAHVLHCERPSHLDKRCPHSGHDLFLPGFFRQVGFNQLDFGGFLVSHLLASALGELLDRTLCAA